MASFSTERGQTPLLNISKMEQMCYTTGAFLGAFKLC
jgi:hypothetical protein